MRKQAQSRDGSPDPRDPEPVEKVQRVEARRCVVCGVKLSNYNPGPNCWQHTIGYPWRGPTAKPKF